MAAEFDNRIRFSATEIDFDNEIGTTGQEHDSYPAPGTPPRYDWLRSLQIGLLSCQSSESEPSQKRTGTIWYNRTKRGYFIWNGSAWETIADHILVDNTTSLLDWFIEIQQKLASIVPKVTFGGKSVASNVARIPVPSSVQSLISEGMRPIVYINGVQVDPRLSRFSSGCPDVVELLCGVVLKNGDRFTVITEKFDQFVLDDVIAR